ncbi:Flagellar biosynthesis protein FlhF [Botrimarina colliarenosi]|uniref:Flagellar biosynthesis protein FlhF n=1 Tax=Botrimarina colliarenosi TaxID=2528001 RepID=A0A5C6AMJ5_9BACT|nr:flagellar GTP-binding protein [Botrimarina colliarenosi]TWU00346.1 Flagellar biosynthesis protein FlhF [Botrimarina colliarenosi]
MTIKTFRARTLRDALAMVRAEFGPEAAVLHSREVNAGPIARLVRGRAVEVAATPDHSPLAEQAARSGAVLGGQRPSLTPPLFDKVVHSPQVINLVKQQPPATPTPTPPTAEPVAAEPAAADPQVQVCGELIAADVAPELARTLVRDAAIRLIDGKSDAASYRRAVVASLREKFAVSGPIRVDANSGRCRVVALVGATGVGKTTTLAKLAANYRLRGGARVGVVTVDTYRVAAVEQLRTYAEIIDLPMEVVATPAEMRAAVAKLAGLDLVLIDTAGRSPRDAERIEELRTLLAEAAPDETHLVASVTSTARGLRDTIQRFAAVKPTSLLLTKLDEAPALGHAAAPVVDAGLPVSYLTDGQSVPEDIRIAAGEELAQRLLGEQLL